jgi:hypothetical protein
MPVASITVTVAHDAAAGITEYSIGWVADANGNGSGTWPMQAGHI